MKRKNKKVFNIQSSFSGVLLQNFVIEFVFESFF